MELYFHSSGKRTKDLLWIITKAFSLIFDFPSQVYYGMFEKDKKRYEGELREYNKSKGRPPLANPSTPKGKASKRAAASSLSGGSGAKKKKKVVKKKIPGKMLFCFKLYFYIHAVFLK